MDLIEVSGKNLSNEFILMPMRIYRHDPNYIRPLDKDILDVFDPKKNKTFRNGTCKRWLLVNDGGEYIGRIAAFVNKKYRNKGDEQKTGGIGFFECINEQRAADMLFDVSKSWLMQQGMEAMDGPINFGERDRWWGLVVQGFMAPIYLMNYNPPYYQELFESYGFKLFYKQICWSMPVQTALGEKFLAQDKKFSAMPEYSVRHIKKNQLEKFARDFAEVYNQAWASHDGNKEMKADIALKMFQSMKPVIDERIVWFAYKDEKPIAFWLSLPELNQVFKKFNGRFGIVEKLRLLMTNWNSIQKFTGIVFGVIPEYQGSGVDYYMIMRAAAIIQHKTGYNEIEMQWQGDFNPKILNISKNLGAHVSRTLVTYRYLFDQTKEFKRHPIFN